MGTFNFNLQDTSVGVAGDWHGDLEWALYALDIFSKNKISTIIHLGDFGILSAASGARYLKEVSKKLARNQQVLYIVLGNHENYAQVANIPFDSDGTQHITNNIFILPRNFRWIWNERSFVALGGANSINYESLVPQISWWPEEAITLGDIYNVANSGKADIMFAHEAPSGVVPNLSSEGWSYKALYYAEQSSTLMRQALDSVKPQLFMHGHYHTYYDKQIIFNDGLQDYSTRIVGLDMNGRLNNLAILDIITLKLKILATKPF